MATEDFDRSFSPLRKGTPPERNLGRWGRQYGGFVGWSELFKHRRVVVLAEASAGKTWELRTQAERLTNAGDAGFFVRIDDLADGRLEDALDAAHTEKFERWRREGNSEAWFFLDSLDEARLNRKSFEGALRRLGKDLGSALARSSIVISCRASDWRVVEDPKVIRTLLPVPPPDLPAATPPDDPEAILLERIFGERDKTQTTKVSEKAPEDLYVVQLMPLTNEEQRAIAKEAEVPNLDAFMDAIRRFGLDEIAERPGDLLGLVSYWRDEKQFGSLAEMTEHAVAAKLLERDRYRPDNNLLSVEAGRHGAERLAAALTFGQAFTLLATGDEPDVTLASGALDPVLVLPDFREDQSAALVRRGVFAPSTYGRLRFHHRGTQEYLTATWLRRLLRDGCPLVRVWDLIFAERYGVETVVPSLRPVAAWLALWQPQICNEIIRREPLTLLIHGDPRSLSIATRSELLMAYARRDEAGTLSHADVENRAIWLFSDVALAPAIRAAWKVSARQGLRTDLLRCVREGKIVACADLARQTALDAERSDTERIVATEALAEMGDTVALDQVATAIRASKTPISVRLAGSLAADLFPAHMGVEDLVRLLSRCPIDERQSSDFASYIRHALNRASPSQTSAFAYAVADAALAIPQKDRHDPLPERFADILKGFASFVTAEVEALDEQTAPDELIRLLRAIARSKMREAKEVEALQGAISAKPALNRALFWADVEREYEPAFAPTAVFQLGFGDLRLWRLLDADLSWLVEDLSLRSRASDRSLVLNAIVLLLRQAERFESDGGWLDRLVAGEAALKAELVRYRQPPPVDPEEPKYEARARQAERQRELQIERNKQAWLNFKADLAGRPESLTELSSASSWTEGGYRLWDLAIWLAQENESASKSPLRWRDLDGAFGQNVSQAFCAGMRNVWRKVVPARPVYSASDRLTTKNINELALGGLNLEAAENETWIASLTDDDVRRAAQHGAFAEHQFPEWLDALMLQRSAVAIPVLLQCLAQEWRRKWGRNELLNRCARPSADAPRALTEEIVRLLLARDPANPDSLERAIAVVGQADLSAEVRGALLRACQRRYRAHHKAGRPDWVRLQLALMFAVAPDRAVTIFAAWLESPEADMAAVRSAFGVLFGRDSSLLPSQVWARFSVATLEQLLRLAYRHVAITPEDSQSRRTMSSRNDPEHARNTILTALLQRTGPDLFASLNRLATEPEFVLSARRFGELAHGVAEDATEGRPWSEAEVVYFEREHTAPVKSGADLLRVVFGILEDIQRGFTSGDASSAAALMRLETEDEVQNYLAEQLNLRSHGRFHAGRETQVAQGNKPDLIVTSNAAPVQIALEVKHGGKSAWTPKVLRSALQDQLAEQYLLPEDRRQGILVVSHHGRRTWKDPDTGEVWLFTALIAWLTAQAAAIARNSAGGVEVKVIGLDPSGAP